MSSRTCCRVRVLRNCRADGLDARPVTPSARFLNVLGVPRAFLLVFAAFAATLR